MNIWDLRKWGHLRRVKIQPTSEMTHHIPEYVLYSKSPLSAVLLQSPTPAKGSSRNQDRFSGLWEWYFDKDEGTPPMGDREGEGPHRDDGTMLKNIRGFLMKRRKSPLKGWHKVRG